MSKALNILFSAKFIVELPNLRRAFVAGMFIIGLTLSNNNTAFAEQRIEKYLPPYGKLELIIDDREPLSSWLNGIELILKEEFGYVPEYNIGTIKMNGAVLKGESVAYYRSKPFYITGNILEYFNNKFKDYGPYYATGNLIFNLIHEMVHIYQLEQLEEFLQTYTPDETMKDSTMLLKQGWGRFLDIYTDEKSIGWIFNHTVWSEGLAQLYAYKICNKLYREAKEENPEKIEIGKDPLLFNKILKEKKFRRSLRERLSQGLFEDIRTLHQIGYINEEKVEDLEFPFEIDAEIVKAVEEKLMEDKKLTYHDSFSSMHLFVLKKLRNNLIKKCHNPTYSWYLFHLNKARQEDSLSLEYLLRHPIPTKRLIPYLEPKFSGKKVGSFRKLP